MAMIRYLSRPGSLFDTPSTFPAVNPATDRLSRLMDDAFLFGRQGSGRRASDLAWVPEVDVEETEDALLLTADLPGFDPSEVEISVENQVLTLSGSRERIREVASPEVGQVGSGRTSEDGGTTERGAEDGSGTDLTHDGREAPESTPRRLHLQERRWGSFSRAFTLPRTIRAEDITASFDRGVLSVRMPKSAEARSRKIEIQTGA